MFILPPEDIPEKMDGGLGDLGGMSRKRSQKNRLEPNDRLRRRTSHGAHGFTAHQRHGGGGQKGIVGGTSGRLEINFKIYDYDETDDDFFMGSYKHKIRWTFEDLQKHQNGEKPPTIMHHDLTNREKAGSFKFRIYTGTLQYYIRWGRNKAQITGNK